MNFLVLLDPCNNPTFLKGLLFAKNIVNVIFILIPIGLIVMLSVDLFKSLISNEEEQKKNIRLIFRRILYSIFIFFVPSVVDLFLLVVSDAIVEVTSDYNNCIVNMDNIEYFEKIANDLEEAEQKEKDQLIVETNEKLEQQLASEIKEKSTSSSSTASLEGTYLGQTYRFTDSQLRGLAMVCQSEQGSVNGAMAEASLMANRFELFGSSYGTGGTGLYNYVVKSGWFSNAQSKVKNTKNLDNAIYAAVKNVLVNGQRTLSLYVDEHDCWNCNNGNNPYCANGNRGDICKIVSNGTTYSSMSQIKNRSNYIRGVTKIYTKYMQADSIKYYTFYSFPASNSDPFGFTVTAKNRYDKLNNG